MPQARYQQPRELSEQEFNRIADALIAQAPEGLSQQEFDRWLNPRLEQAIGEAENTPAPIEGSSLGRFASGVAEVLNPIEIAKGLYGAVRHPIDTVTNLANAQVDQFRQAGEAFREGGVAGTLEGVGRVAAGAVPLLGPMAAEAGEKLGQGDVAGAAGTATGLLAPMGVGPALRAARTVTPARAATALESGASSRVVDVMAPKVGPNKARFGGMAEDVAGAIAKDPSMAAWSREGLAAKVSSKLSEAEQALDAAADARLSARTFPTAPLIQDLLQKRAKLTAEAVEASQPVRSTSSRTSAILDERGKPIEVTTRRAEPVGRDVVPGPNAPRVAMIDQAIEELRALGPDARYEPIRRIRQSYDGPARAVYAPSITADYLKAQGGKLGAADVTGTLREGLARMDPATAAANAPYALWRKANDVLEATAEVERTRPKTGRQIITRAVATLFGGQQAGVAGAITGAAGAPIIDSLLSSSPTIKLQSARLMSQLAEAIRRGDTGTVTSTTHQLRSLARRLSPAAAGAAGRTSTDPAAGPLQPAYR